MIRKVILEGLDRCGKTTIQNMLFSYFSTSGKWPAFTYKTGAIYKEVPDIIQTSKEYYTATMNKLCDNEYSIFDRLHIGEAVYPNKYRGYDGNYVFDIEQELKLEANNYENTLLVLLWDYPENLIARDDGLSLSKDVKDIKEETQLFFASVAKSIIPNKLVICVAGRTISEVFDAIIKEIEKKDEFDYVYSKEDILEDVQYQHAKSKYIVSKDADSFFKRKCTVFNDMVDKNEVCSPRGKKIVEEINSTYVIRDIQSCIISNPYRKLSIKYLKAELDWYRSGDLSIDKIKNYSKMWNLLLNDDNTINSNYGYFVWYQKTTDGYSQYKWVIDSLLNDRDTRQAIINFNNISHKYTAVKDFVCTETAQYFIRNNRLVCTINMRSQDLIYGFGYDLPFFCYLMNEIYEELKDVYKDLEFGEIVFNVGSLHVYEHHFDMIKLVAEEKKHYKSAVLSSI